MMNKPPLAQVIRYDRGSFKEAMREAIQRLEREGYDVSREKEEFFFRYHEEA